VGLSREQYAALYGPTTGDRVRLGDTDLFATVEADDNRAGSEPLVGMGRTVRPGQLMDTAAAVEDALDICLTNVLLLDPVLGVRKTSIGIRRGRVAAIGRAGDPGADAEVAVPISAATGVIPGEGLIATPGAIDSHVHLIGPQLVPAALAGGTTTFAAMSYSGAFDVGINPRANLDAVLAAWASVPLNLIPIARASTDNATFLDDLIALGAGALKVHEDLGASPAVLDAALAAAERHDIQVALHADGLGESATLEETLAAIDGRAVHAYHVEGCGGGPVNLLEVVAHEHVLPSSTTPTVPFGVNAVDEHATMIATVHRLSPLFANDARAAGGRIRSWTMAAESVLHDLGAISVITSDSMGMGRVGEVARRTWQLAHVMQNAAAPGAPEGNARILRYLAKITINPALVHGVAHEVGSLEPGKLADVVIWRPAFFGAKPQLVLKAGFPVWGALGSGSGSTRLGEPMVQGGLWGSVGAAPPRLSTVFVAEEARAAVAARWQGPVGAVRRARSVRKRDLVANHATPAVSVDGERCEVRIDGTPATLSPVGDLPLNRAYFLA
jgi:urease subunit alpha